MQNNTTVNNSHTHHQQMPKAMDKPSLATFTQLLVLQRFFNRPRGHKCLMA